MVRNIRLQARPCVSVATSACKSNEVIRLPRVVPRRQPTKILDEPSELVFSDPGSSKMLRVQSSRNPDAVEGPFQVRGVRIHVRVGDVAEQAPLRADLGAPQAVLQEGGEADDMTHADAR